MDKKNLMVMEFTETIGQTAQFEKVAIFNRSAIPQDEVKYLLRTQRYRDNNLVMVVSKEDYEAVFGKLDANLNASEKVRRFLDELPAGKVREYEYQALFDGEWMPVSRINKRRETFTLSHSGGELPVHYSKIQDVKGYLDD